MPGSNVHPCQSTISAQVSALRAGNLRRQRTPTCGNGIVHIIEADLIRLRTKEDMRIAKAKGRLRGKQPKLNPRQEAHLVALLKSGEYSTAELGDLFGVARSTVYRAIGREAARQRAERSGAGPVR